MKLIELMLEAREDFLLQQYGDKLAAAAKRERKQMDGAAVMQQLRNADPTHNGKYLQWIIGQYIGKMFRLEDVPRVREQLTQFAELARRKRLDQSDLNKYTYRTLTDALDAAVDGGEGKVMDIDTTGCHVMYNGPLGLLAVPQDEQAAINLGKGTSWCTARDGDDNMYDHYADTGSLFVWIGSAKEKYQFHIDGVYFDRIDKSDSYNIDLNKENPYSFVYIVTGIAVGDDENDDGNIQFMDRKDQPLSDSALVKLRQHPVLSKLFAYFDKAVGQLDNDAVASLYYGRFGMTPPDGTRPASARDLVKRVATSIYNGARHNLNADDKKTVANDPIAAIALSMVTRERTAESDKIALNLQSKEPHVVGQYLETFGLTIEDLASAMGVKSNIRMTARQAYQKIQRNGGKATQQELDILKTDPDLASMWATIAFKKPWPDAEPYIIKNEVAAFRYAAHVKGKWPEFEQQLLDHGSTYHKARYAAKFFNGKWPEAERTLSPDELQLYNRTIQDAMRFA